VKIEESKSLLRNVGTSLNPFEIVFSMQAYHFHLLGEVMSLC
jgi:hypothetical protein